jgi:hypothetical protein
VTTEICVAKHDEIATAINGHMAPHEPPVGLLARAAENAGSITKILTLVSVLGVGLWAVHKFVVRMETALDRQSGQQTQATKRLMTRLDTPMEPQVVYVPVVVKPDAGVRRRPPRRAYRPRRKRATPP